LNVIPCQFIFAKTVQYVSSDEMALQLIGVCQTK